MSYTKFLTPEEMNKQILIGIDPGVNTGIAVYLKETKKLSIVETCGIIKAQEWVLRTCGLHGKENILVRIEDPNKRKWFGNAGREKLQGAGSIKRDYSFWTEFLQHHEISYEGVAPKNIKTKTDAAYFKKLTGWEGRTSTHSRDAAMLVYQY